MEPCENHAVLWLLKDMYATNASAWDLKLKSGDLCGDKLNLSSTGDPNNISSEDESGYHHHGRDIYAFLTPFIIVFGVIGNLLSLWIFTLKSMRGLSASMYLAAISVSDLLVLLTYVLFEWLSKGLTRWPGAEGVHVMHSHGICQLFLLLSYTFRFSSVWLITLFTVERYVAINKPLHRRILCTRTFSRRLLAGVFAVALLISLYKPALSGVNQGPHGPICGSLQAFVTVNFYLDAIYGIVITLLPFIIITVFNGLILRTLLMKDKRQPDVKLFVKENRLRLEFTLILLSISTSFICLNLPYFVVWIQGYLLSREGQESSSMDKKRDLLILTKTVFYLNYCINIFLYAFTGKQYRMHLKNLVCCSKPTPDENGTPVRSMHTLHTMDSTSTGKATMV